MDHFLLPKYTSLGRPLSHTPILSYFFLSQVHPNDVKTVQFLEMLLCLVSPKSESYMAKECISFIHSLIHSLTHPFNKTAENREEI